MRDGEPCLKHLLVVVTFGSFFFVCFQQIATQIAVLIAKVARLDCPRQWPELIPILLESVKGQDGLQQHRALLTFYHVTKTLASKRLAQDRRLFQDVSLTCFSLLFCHEDFLELCHVSSTFSANFFHRVNEVNIS